RVFSRASIIDFIGLSAVAHISGELVGESAGFNARLSVTSHFWLLRGFVFLLLFPIFFLKHKFYAPHHRASGIGRLVPVAGGDTVALVIPLCGIERDIVTEPSLRL